MIDTFVYVKHEWTCKVSTC